MDDALKTPYPSYDVLNKWDTPSWDDQTRAVIDRRLHAVPERQFFTEDAWNLLGAVVDRLIPQPDRPEDPIPIVPWIDQKLHEDRGSGYRYASMPPQREAWRRGLRAVAEESLHRFGMPFVALDVGRQDALLTLVHRGDVATTAWEALSPRQFFTSILLKTVAEIYYSHPAAWSEIGFDGPASPRGYVRLGADQHDPWEAKEGHA